MLATFKISAICVLTFLELAVMMVLESCSGETHPFIFSPQWREWRTSWPAKSCEITYLYKWFLPTFNASACESFLLSFFFFSCYQLHYIFIFLSWDSLHMYADGVCHLWQSCNSVFADIMIWFSRRRRFPSGVWSEREHCTLWKQNPQHKYCFEGRSNTTSNSQLEDHNILEKILFLMVPIFSVFFNNIC